MFGRGRGSGGNESRSGRDGGRGRASGRSSPGFVSMRLLEKDPGPDQPIWYGGAASSFVIARKFMETRAKDEGVWEFWTGEESTDFIVTAPEIDYKFDASFSLSLVEAASTEGIGLKAAARGIPPNPNDVNDHGSAPFDIHKYERDYITHVDPLYYPAEGEREPSSGILYAMLVQKTSDVGNFKYHVRGVKDSMLKWDASHRKFKSRMSKAEAVMLKCLGPAPTAAVRPLLNEKKYAKAWEALTNKYTPPGDTDVIRELEEHLKDVRLKSPSRLDEYVNTVDTLRGALEECGVKKSDAELIAILKNGILGTVEGKKAFENIFATARIFDWDAYTTLETLAKESHAMSQEQGIEALRRMEVSREIDRRAPAVVSPKAAAGEQQLSSGQQGKIGLPKGTQAVAGSDGRTNDTINCFRCQRYGHIAKWCPDRVQQPTPAGAATSEVAEEEQSGDESVIPAIEAESYHVSAQSLDGGFHVEVDDSYDDLGGEVFASDAEVLQLFSHDGGGAAKKC
jgi:hypothetical protein